MSGSVIRIAVCQLESHPALHTADRNYLREPFAPDLKLPSLADLDRHAFDVVDAQKICEKDYTEWCGERLRQILDWLQTHCPSLL